MVQKFKVKSREICPVSSFKNSEVEGIVSQAQFEYLPRNEKELQSILLELNSQGIEYDVVSGACNWGLGQKFSQNSVLINLENLKKIEHDEQTGVIYVEAGVTQEEVNLYLDSIDSAYYLDVTGSAKQSSLVGNCLERGISYSSQRLKSLINMEVYLRCGTKISTGLFKSKELRKLYPHNSGPELKSLFLQSRYGVVVGIYYQLKKKEAYSTSIQLKLKNTEQLLAVLPELSDLMRDGVISGIPHIANSERSQQSFVGGLKMLLGEEEFKASTQKLLNKLLGEEGAWTGLISIKGEKPDVAWRAKRIRTLLRKKTQIRELSPFKLRVLKFLRNSFANRQWAKLIDVLLSFAGLSQGQPTNMALLSINESLRGEYSKENLDKALKNSDRCFLYCLPIMKFSPQKVNEALEIINKYWGQWEESPAITLNPLDANVVELVVSIRFQRKVSGEMHLAMNYMVSEFEKNDIYLYRHPIFSDKRMEDESRCLEVLDKIVKRGN
jgi:4-cresol dehydrogenase (hydroxylating)